MNTRVPNGNKWYATRSPWLYFGARTQTLPGARTGQNAPHLQSHGALLVIAGCVFSLHILSTLVNILGASFNEIHNVDIIHPRGEYTKSPHFKKATARIPGCEKEPEVPDETHTFFNPA